jgi:hypothetical protein
VACVALVAGPAAAHAASVSVDRDCYASGELVIVGGSGFAPGAPVSITGVGTAATNANADGDFDGVLVRAPRVGSAAPRRFTVRATSPSQASLTGLISFPVVRARFWSNAPISGRPSELVTWRFAGFVRARPIYGHLRFGGRDVATRRFGTARGACGLLTVRAPRVPLRHVRAGRWVLKLDQAPGYSPTAPGRSYTFQVSRGT